MGRERIVSNPIFKELLIKTQPPNKKLLQQKLHELFDVSDEIL